jgi:hypothetical protein
VAVHDGKPYLAYRGADDTDLWWMSFDDNSWSADRKVASHASQADGRWRLGLARALPPVGQHRARRHRVRRGLRRLGAYERGERGHHGQEQMP